MLVRRTLPHRDRRMVGAWCFIDHYGPIDLSITQGMRVPPHPHTGLQTVSWLLEGAIRHTDSVGSHVDVRPGQLNLMTAGRGISHAEDSLAEPAVLHGIQLWVALPEAMRHQLPHFEQHANLPHVKLPGAEVVVFMGALLGVHSPAATYSPIVGAEIRLDPGASVQIPVERDHEYAVLLVDGDARYSNEVIAEHALAYLGSNRDLLHLDTSKGCRMLLLGGEPFEEQIVMWWNFIGRDHDEISRMRDAWQGHHEDFGSVNHAGPRLEAPQLPNTRLTARGRSREK